MAPKGTIFLLTLFIISFIEFSKADLPFFNEPTCGTNEEYTKCGSRCPLTCTNASNPPYCKGCQKGCFCKPGYARDGAGACVVILTGC